MSNWEQALRLHAGVGLQRLLHRRAPISVTFILTNRCNLKCSYCDIYREKSEEMDTETIVRGMRELAGRGMQRVSFSGGEIFLRKDLGLILKAARELGLFTSINTNGWFHGDELDAVAPFIDMIVFSLDGDRETHDRACGRPGSWERVQRALGHAAALGLERAVIGVLGPWNFDQMHEIARLAGEHDAWVYFQPAQESCYHEERGLDPFFTPERLGEMADRLVALESEGYRIAATPGYVRRLRELGAPDGSRCRDCMAGRYFASILPDGTTVPCHLQSKQREFLSARQAGFYRAFRDMPLPNRGDGCAISPYQEMDLIFRLDPVDVLAIASRVTRSIVARPRPASTAQPT